jgi:hypothetical protein
MIDKTWLERFNNCSAMWNMLYKETIPEPQGPPLWFFVSGIIKGEYHEQTIISRKHG